MNNQILADYYEERGFVNKSKRLRRHVLVLYKRIYYHYKQYILQGYGHGIDHNDTCGKGLFYGYSNYGTGHGCGYDSFWQNKFFVHNR